MKKLICLLVTVVLALTCVTPVFAHDNKGGQDKKNNNSSPYTSYTQYANVYTNYANPYGGYTNPYGGFGYFGNPLYSYSGMNMDSLKYEFKKSYKDAEKRSKILKEISKLKKEIEKLESKADKLEKRLMFFVEGNEVESDVPPVIKDGRTLVPVRALTEALGANVQWDPRTNVVTIIKNGTVIELKMNSNKIKINGMESTIDVPAANMNDRIVVPIRFIAENFNQQVEWDEETGSIIIISKDGTAPAPTTPAPNPATPNVVSINDNVMGTANGQFEFVGNWDYGFQSGAYGDDNHWSVDGDAYYQVKFTGTQIKLYGAKDPYHGIASVTIDGTVETAVDLYAPTRADNVLLYASPVFANGEHTLKVKVTGAKNSASAGVYVVADRVEVVTAAAPANTGDLAKGKEVAASSSYDVNYGAEKAVDGNASTIWLSQFKDDEWIYVDLGAVQSVSKVKLNWEAAFGKTYQIQVSTDGVNWTGVYTTTTGDGGIDSISFNPVNARFVKVLGIQRGTNYGYALYDFEVYNH